MKWVKATDRLPNKPGHYFVIDKGRSIRKKTSWYYCKGRGQSLLLRRPFDIEWLDESEPPNKSENTP